MGRAEEQFESRKRAFDAAWNEVDAHNKSVERSRTQGVVDAVVDFNKYARPFVLGEMDGTVHKPYVTADQDTDAYRRNYDLIDWSSK